MYCGYPFEPSRSYEANVSTIDVFNKRKRRKISLFRLKIIILTREQSIQVLYTCNGHDLSENVNNKDTDLRMLIKVFDVRWSVDSTVDSRYYKAVENHLPY